MARLFHIVRFDERKQKLSHFWCSTDLFFPELDSRLDQLIAQIWDGEGKSWHKCLKCEKMMKQKDKMRRHVEVHMGWSIPCPLCSEVCKTRNGLSHHHAKVHKPYLGI